MLPGEAELVSEWAGLSGKARSVKRFERFTGLDIALYKNYIIFLPFMQFSAGTRCSSTRLNVRYYLDLAITTSRVGIRNVNNHLSISNYCSLIIVWLHPVHEQHDYVGVIWGDAGHCCCGRGLIPVPWYLQLLQLSNYSFGITIWYIYGLVWVRINFNT